jgi:hypothetical protein
VKNTIKKLSNRDEFDGTMPSLETFQRIAEKFHKLWTDSVMMELCLVNKIFICIVCMCDECMC